MGKLTLYTYPQGKNAFKALIAAEYVGVTIDVPPFQFGVDNKTEEFLKKNPNGKVPTLETPEGCIFESNAIARYVARLGDAGLFGSSTIETAQVEQWIDFSANEIDFFTTIWFAGRSGYIPYNAQLEKTSIQKLEQSLKVLDDVLLNKTYIVGDHVTLADIILVCNLLNGYTKVFEESFRSKYPNVTRYFLTLINQPNFCKVVPKVVLCEKIIPITKQAAGAHTQKAKEAAKKETVKKEATKKEAAKKEEDMEDPAQAEKEKEKKAKNPLDELPPSKMILDSWKRLYSNTPSNKFREICINGLWNGADIPNSLNNEHFEGFDPEGFSIWFCSYKYPEENTVNYVVMNKVSGFFQRIEYAKKYAFGVMAILQEKSIFHMKGVFVFRGQDIPPIMKENCPDLDLYDWEKCDISKPEVKARIEDIICEEGKIDGLENIECKVFK